MLISGHAKCEVYLNVENPVVQRVDGIVHKIINHHPVDSTICHTYPVDGDEIISCIAPSNLLYNLQLGQGKIVFNFNRWKLRFSPLCRDQNDFCEFCTGLWYFSE